MQVIFKSAAMAAAISVAGCATSPAVTTVPATPAPIQLQSTLDVAEIKRRLAPGNNTIRGGAFIKKRDGAVVTCAGGEAILLPVTAYVSERVRHIYDNIERGYAPHHKVHGIQYANTPPEYLALWRRAACDARGDFVFHHLQAGDYFVAATVDWHTTDAQSPYLPRAYNPYKESPQQRALKQGGWLLQKVAVAGGEVKEILLTP